MPTTYGKRPTLQTTLKFRSKFERFSKLRKLKKQHKNVEILEKGFTPIGYSGDGYYWATVKYEP